MKQYKSIEKNFPYKKYYDDDGSLPIASGNIQVIYRDALQKAIHDEFGKPINEIDKVEVIRFEYEFLDETINWLTSTFHKELNFWESEDFNHYILLENEFNLALMILNTKLEALKVKFIKNDLNIIREICVRIPKNNKHYNPDLPSEAIKILFWAFKDGNCNIFNGDVKNKSLASCYMALTGYSDKQFLKTNSGNSIRRTIPNPDSYDKLVSKLSETIKFVENLKKEIIP